MNEMTRAIAAVKESVSKETWEGRIRACQNSGMSVRAWCEENGINRGAYYFHLRKLRENILSENRIVPITPSGKAEVRNIRIRQGDIEITLPEEATSEQLTAILQVLRSC